MFYYRGRRSKRKKQELMDQELLAREQSDAQQYSFQHPAWEEPSETDVYEASPEWDTDLEPLPTKEKYPEMPDDTYELPQHRTQKLHDRTDQFLENEWQKQSYIDSQHNEPPIKPTWEQPQPRLKTPVFKKTMMAGFVLFAIAICVMIAYWLVTSVLTTDFLFFS